MNKGKETNRKIYEKHITSQKESKISSIGYCRLNDLSHSKFNYYKGFRLKSRVPKFSTVKVNETPDPKSVKNVKTFTPNIDARWLAEFINNLEFVK